MQPNDATQNYIQPVQQQAVANVNKPKNKKKNNFLFYLWICLLFVFCSLVGAIFAYFSELDLEVFSITLNGQITNTSGQAIPEADVYLNNIFIGSANEQGMYRITGLKKGEVNITVRADGYSPQTQTITLDRSPFDYSTLLNLQLAIANVGSIEGRIIPPYPSYSFEDDRVTILEQTYPIDNLGIFKASEIPIGENLIEIKSPNFVDITETIEIIPGRNEIQAIEVTPAGDIEDRLISYVRENIVRGVDISIENIPSTRITFPSEDIFNIKDLLIDRTYNVRITAINYEPRDYSVMVQEGINPIFDLNFVEQGKAFYIETRDRNSEFIITSDYDGQDKFELNVSDFEPNNAHFNEVDNLYYFTSNYERIRGVLGEELNLAYAFNPNTNAIQRVTTNTSNLGIIFPFFEANAFVNIFGNDRRGGDRLLQIASLDGTVLRNIKTYANKNINQVLMSNDRNIVYTVEVDTESGNTQLVEHRLNQSLQRSISSRENIRILDISNNGTELIYTAKDDLGEFDNLYYYNSNSQETRTIIVGHSGKDYQFIKNGDSQIMYINTQENRLELFDINQNEEERLLNAPINQNINQLYQQDNFAFYITNQGLYIFDPANPHPNKLVTEGNILNP